MSAGTDITLDQINQWLTEVKIMGKKITPEDTKACFDKFNSEKIDPATFMKFLDDLGQRKGVAPAELKMKLAACGSLVEAAKAKIIECTGTVADLTDQSSKPSCKRK